MIYSELEKRQDLPDKFYFLKIIKRQWLFSLGMGAVILAIAIPASFFVTNTYQSSSSFTFETSDVSDMSRGYSQYLLPTDNMATSFQIRFSTPDFLVQVADVANLDLPSGMFAKIMDFVKIPTSKKIESNVIRKSIIAEWLKDKLLANADQASGVLSVTSFLDTPEKAQSLTAQAVESFIQTEWQSRLQRIDLRLDFLRGILLEGKNKLTSQQKEKSPEKGESTTNLSKKDPSSKSDLTLKEKEAELLDRIRILESEISNMNIARNQSIVVLETEFQRLRTMLQPNHPDLIARKEQLQALLKTPAINQQAMDRLRDLRRELWQVRSRMLYPGLTGLGDTSLSLEENMERSHISMITQRISELELEKSNIERQLAEPGLRTSVKIVKHASFEPLPLSNRQQKVRISAIILAIMFVFLSGAIKEIKCPLARDDWRIVRRTGKPILSQFSRESLVRYPILTPDITDNLREALRLADDASLFKARTLLAHRRLELDVGKFCLGRTILFLSAGAADQGGDFFFSFLNVFATDRHGPVVLLDCNHIDPVSSGDAGSVSSKGAASLIDVLLGKSVWRDIILSKTSERAFDLIPPPLDLTGQSTRLMQSQLLQPLLADLAEHYEMVFVRGLPETHFVENSALTSVTSDTILCIDAARTTFFELDRTLVHLDSDKLRGLVLLGT